ncbi:GTPase-activating protein LRG1 SCDLUD_003044 [Saccharomycodes ludwigii]|uniref:GTPase-activating protein LRG1 n=1 Tax=Saccharomycodes ludwigii TaxID=36035 RepID=UPI001E85C271|nr:hypothetical protein SCDLUD_003044 [Saccharomycodes ludwigii]KAH3901547.1 hypothetical protein SCDLUD_003044 [Saccharomycodes ludwigii]
MSKNKPTNNATHSHNNTQDRSKVPISHSSSRQVKRCCKCGKSINGQLIKALGDIYHQNCFTCYDCGTICKPKYFPFELPDTKELVPLCHYDYFKRNNLLCYVCNEPLRGTFYNAFGRLYDEEHFCCKICGEKCSLKTCFNYNNSLYCKYHYLKFFSKRCKGCKYPITDQHFEFPRGDKIYRWHPECYGIHRYWHIDLVPESLAIPELPIFDQSQSNNNSILSSKDTNPSPKELEVYIKSSTTLIFKTWTILYRFEEETAACISDMIQYATSENNLKGVNSTALFVLKIECLFKALDALQSLTNFATLGGRIKNSYLHAPEAPQVEEDDDEEEEEEEEEEGEEENYDVNKTRDNNNGNILPNTSNNMNVKKRKESISQKYRKFPRNLSTGIMVYLQLLRKFNPIPKDKDMPVSKIMTVINGLSHSLKLLIRYGLFNSLEYNIKVHSTNTLSKFLREVEKNLNYSLNYKDPFEFIDVKLDATDSCVQCGKYIQQECIRFQNKRWHIQCFNCSCCHKHIEKYDILDAAYLKNGCKVLCAQCSLNEPASISGFKPVTRLSQLIFLLKMALVKTKTVMEMKIKESKLRQEKMLLTDNKNDAHFKINVRNIALSSPGKTCGVMQQDSSYVRTLNDIKALRAKRNSLRISRTDSKVKKSQLVETAQKNSEENKSADDSLEIEISEDTENDSPKDTTMFNNSKTLTLDDISRIVAAEQARELRPNAFRHFNKLKEIDEDVKLPTLNKSGVYYSDLSSDHLVKLQLIALSVICCGDHRLYNKDQKIMDLVLQIDSKKSTNSSPVTTDDNSNGSSPVDAVNGFWGIFKPRKPKDLRKNTNVYGAVHHVFGESLDRLTEYVGIDSDLGIGSSRVKIPLLVDETISTLKQMDMSVEGVFRKNGNIKRLRLLTEEINSNPTTMPDLSKENAVQLSALLKKFLRELPDPLLTFSLYDLWIKIPTVEPVLYRNIFYATVYALLPKFNRNVSEVLFSFLSWVSSFSHLDDHIGSKMDIHNLSTVITPNILYAKSKLDAYTLTNYSSAAMKNNGESYFLAIEAVDYLITHNEDLAMVPKFMINLLNGVVKNNWNDFEQIYAFVESNYALIDFTEFNFSEKILAQGVTSQVKVEQVKINE